jgi:M6 family metalloprotease-like protein
MSLGQLFPQGTVPSAGVASRGFAYDEGFDFTTMQPQGTCHGFTVGADAAGSPAYPQRIREGFYQLPGTTDYYGDDKTGSALVGALTGVGALFDIDSACGPTGKLVYDAAQVADPEIDYSDYDTDKDGVVDFFMTVFAGCGGHGASQIPGNCPYDTAPYDNVWPHSSSLEFYYTDPQTGLKGYVSDDQLENLHGQPVFYTDAGRTQTTTQHTDFPVYVRVGPYNVNPETSIEHASVISHEYGHSLGLPDFYSLGGRETYGDWNLMATDKSQHMDVFSRQELGWVVPEVLQQGDTQVQGWSDSKQDTHSIEWQTPSGEPYTLSGPDVHNSQAFVAKLPSRQLIKPEKFDTGDGASLAHAWWTGSGNDFGCPPQGGHNLDLVVPGLADLPEGSQVRLELASHWDIEWDFDYGFVMTSTDGGETYQSQPSEQGYTTPQTQNPNANSCQQQYGNGLTGTSGSYQAGSQDTDRLLGEYPEPVFLTDTYDVSELAGTDGVVRFSYATDAGLARPGWFIDDVTVTATTPSGQTQTLLETDFEGEGDETDPRVYNGGCKDATAVAAQCTTGWSYISAVDGSPADHAYYLELRDRSGFDLDGMGQNDRDPISFAPGLSVVYTDETHGYGNVGTSNPPAQSPLDSQPQPGNDTPDLADAAWTAVPGDSGFSDSGEGHTDNYTDPSQQQADPRYPDVANPWRFRFDCLAFDVLSMSGDDNGPVQADGDLTADVGFTLGAGCGPADYGYGDVPLTANTVPTR